MYFDTLTLAAVADQVREALLGGRVQRIVRPSNLSLGLEIYAGERLQLLISAEPQCPRLHLTSHRVRRGVESASPLELLLRKYVRGARLRSVEQVPLERVLRFRFSGEEGPTELVCETIGRYSNVILLDGDGVVLDALKRIPPSINRYRTVLPQHRYVLPPPQEKEHPLQLTVGILREALSSRDEPRLWRRLVSVISGTSPLLAREMVYRAVGTVDADCDLSDERTSCLVTTVHEMFSLVKSHAWTPCVAYAECEEGPREYAPYALTHMPRWEAREGMSQAIEEVLAAVRTIDAYAEARRRVLEAVDAQIARRESRLHALEVALIPEEEMERLQAWGNALLAMARSISPGQTRVVVDSEIVGLPGVAPGDSVTIPLNASLSAVENAQALFRRYRKARAAAQGVPDRIRAVQLELDYLRQLRTDALIAEDRPALDQVNTELSVLGGVPQKGRGPKRPAQREPRRLEAPDGMQILVGRNSRENDMVTFRLSSPNDLWLHAHGVPGSHVIVRSGGSAISDETLLLAARLAARYSEARSERRVQVDYAERRHVRRLKRAGPGMVTYTHEQSLVVAPFEEEPA